MPKTHILAFDTAVEVNTPADPALHSRAARYTTMAVAAVAAKGAPINNIRAYVEATHTRACKADAHDLQRQMSRWASQSRDRHGLLDAVCALLLIGQHRDDAGEMVRSSADVPPEVRDAAGALFGHDIETCETRACRVCWLARSGDWPRAIRASAGDEADVAGAALVDAYRAARRGGYIPELSVQQPLVAPSSADRRRDEPALF
jgi:hypothetical protein